MEVFAHPELCTSPDLIRALWERLGMLAVVDGHRVRLIGVAKPRGQPLYIPTPESCGPLKLVAGSRRGQP